MFHGMLNAELMATLKAGNKSVYAWIVDEPVELKRVLDLAVDGVVTNRPALLRDTINYLATKCPPASN